MRRANLSADPGPTPDDAGFTLIEVLAALMIFAVVSLGLLHSVLSAVDTSGDSRNRVVASNIAAGAVDQARADGRADLDAVVSDSWTREVEGTTYTVQQSATWIPGTGGTSCGASAGTSLLYKRVGVAVSWPNMGATQPVRSDTVISPPAGVFDPTTGNLAVAVMSRDATGIDLAEVRVSGPTNVTLLTDDTGCAFFAGIPAGSYDVEISKTDHVDHEGSIASIGQVTAVAGEAVAYQADIDRAATLEIDGLADPLGTAVDGALYPLATEAVMSLGHSDVQLGRRLVPVQLGTDDISVFPFASGYRTWLGSCSDADPEGSSTEAVPVPWWSVPVPAPVTVAEPDSRTEVLLRGAQVELTVSSGGAPVAGATVTATHAAEAGNGCNSGETLTLGTTDSAGLVRATMPYGKGWAFDAGGVPLTTADLDPAATYPRVLP